jgi:hypothetical protein
LGKPCRPNECCCGWAESVSGLLHRTPRPASKQFPTLDEVESLLDVLLDTNSWEDLLEQARIKREYNERKSS